MIALVVDEVLVGKRAITSNYTSKVGEIRAAIALLWRKVLENRSSDHNERDQANLSKLVITQRVVVDEILSGNPLFAGPRQAVLADNGSTFSPSDSWVSR